MYVFTYTCIHIHACPYAHSCTHTCTHAYVHIHTYMYITCIYICTHINRHTHVHIIFATPTDMYIFPTSEKVAMHIVLQLLYFI